MRNGTIHDRPLWNRMNPGYKRGPFCCSESITGIRTQTGNFDLTFRAGDALSGWAQKSFTLTIK